MTRQALSALVLAVAAATGAATAMTGDAAAGTARPATPRPVDDNLAGLARAAVSPAATAGVVACDGNGTSGKRVQILYVREPSQTDRLSQYLATYQGWAAQIDLQFRTDAEATGGYRRVRFVTDASCQPTVTEVVVPAGTLTDWGHTFTALKNAGYNRTDRKYLAFTETTSWCGLGGGGPGAGDTTPGSTNRYNTGPDLASVGSGCWGWAPAAHELIHTLGAVLPGAPHATSNGHCWDDEDIMCYDDGGIPNPPGQLVKVCAGAPENQIDCNHDDYYSTKPVSGSWLASHWNSANNQFLITAPVLEFTSYPALATGASGATVEAAEYLLQQAGFAPGPVDGVYDDATAAAVTAYRQNKSLPAGATIDSHVWTALLSAGTKPTLQNGSTGADVRRLQRSLTAALGRTIAIDGSFGSGTQQAVKDYQSSRGLSADGIVGSLTWTALQSGR
ncbi:MAG: peptidoglycan-binding protein [Mycobacteriales bacterium]